MQAPSRVLSDTESALDVDRNASQNCSASPSRALSETESACDEVAKPRNWVPHNGTGSPEIGQSRMLQPLTFPRRDLAISESTVALALRLCLRLEWFRLWSRPTVRGLQGRCAPAPQTSDRWSRPRPKPLEPSSCRMFCRACSSCPSPWKPAKPKPKPETQAA